MKIKKIYALLLALVLIVSLGAGCSGGNKNDPGTNSGTNTPPANNEQSGNEGKTEETPAWQTQEITLTFASWDDAEMENKMFQAFMEKYPNITVTKDETINISNYTEALANAAAASKLPDVFWLNNVPVAVENDWVLDIAPYWNNDPEVAEIFPNIAANGAFGDKRFASPTFQFVMGVFLNKTLLEKNNIELPPYDWTIDQMLEIAGKISKPSEHIYGLSAPWGSLMFNEYWPFANNPSLGYNTFDGEKFHFTHPDWIEGYNKNLELRRLKVEDVMTGDEKAEVFGSKDASTFMEGHLAMSIDGSWNSAYLPVEMEKKGTGEVDFYPYPAGNDGQKMPVVLDFIGVSSTTKHPEAAYELMKWMTWGEDGWLKRLEFQKELGQDISKLPVAGYDSVWSQIEEQLKLDGFKAIIKLIDQAVPNFDKVLPGWNEFNGWANEQKIFERLNKGELSPADVAKELEDKANEFVSEAMAKLVK